MGKWTPVAVTSLKCFAVRRIAILRIVSASAIIGVRCILLWGRRYRSTTRRLASVSPWM